MTDLAICEAYLLCSLGKNGKLFKLSSNLSVCVLAGAILDLISDDAIGFDEKKKLFAKNEPKSDKAFLKPLYEEIKQLAPVKIEKIVDAYAMGFSSKKLNELISLIGKSLLSANLVDETESGVFKKNIDYIPHEHAVDNVIQMVRAEMLEEHELSDDIIALVALLNRSNFIKNYFSKYESAQLKTRLKEIKNTDSNKVVNQMLDYIDALLVAIIVAT